MVARGAVQSELGSRRGGEGDGFMEVVMCLRRRGRGRSPFVSGLKVVAPLQRDEAARPGSPLPFTQHHSVLPCWGTPVLYKRPVAATAWPYEYYIS